VNFVWERDKPKGLFLGSHGKEKFCCFLREEGEIFKFSKELFFWRCEMGCLEKVDGLFFFGSIFLL
jgi:hypothetical protein